MKLNRTFAATLLVTLLGGFALQASANTPRLDHIRHLDRHNSAGTSFAVMPPHSNHFCYISRVGVRETDTGTEMSMCRVRRSGTVWLLEAILGRNSDQDVFCSAHCYRTDLW